MVGTGYPRLQPPHFMAQTYPSYVSSERKELCIILRKALKHLPPLHRCVFALRYTEELPIKRIAARISRSEDTVKTHLQPPNPPVKGVHGAPPCLPPYQGEEHTTSSGS